MISLGKIKGGKILPDSSSSLNLPTRERQVVFRKICLLSAVVLLSQRILRLSQKKNFKYFIKLSQQHSKISKTATLSKSKHRNSKKCDCELFLHQNEINI